GYADGRNAARVLAPGGAVGGARSGWRAEARAPARREFRRIPRDGRARRLLPGELPPSRRVARPRPQRGKRTALYLPRLEILNRRRLHGHADRTRRAARRVLQARTAAPLSGARSRRHGLGLSWPPRDAAEILRLRVSHPARRRACPLRHRAWQLAARV